MRRACLPAGTSFIKTVYLPRGERMVSPASKNKKSQRQGMINCTPVKGNGLTLSRYCWVNHALGEGTSAKVYEAPRGYVVRDTSKRSPSTVARIDSADYRDISSFCSLTTLTETQQVCRDAGIDLYQYFKYRRWSLTLSDFETASADLKRLHQRGLYHMDIKLENMACKVVAGKPQLSFIDCDSITNAAGVTKAAITYPREALRPGSVTRIRPRGKADDEYAFLLLLMVVTDLSFVSVYARLGRPGAERMRGEVRRYSTIFADKFVKSEHREALVQFVTEPIDAQALNLPLHDAIDWSRGLDLCSAMQQCDVEAISRVGNLGLVSSMSSASKLLFLIAQDANGNAGVYRSFILHNALSMKAWTDLTDRLPDHDKEALVDCVNRMNYRSRLKRRDAK